MTNNVILTTKRSKEILTVLVNVYAKAVEDTRSLDPFDYHRYLRERRLEFGACSYLENAMHLSITHPYWIRRNLTKNKIYVCPCSYLGHEYLQKRLEIYSRELKLINRWGWFARFIRL